MPEENDRQAILDEEHLKLLSWGYMISGGFTALFSLFGLFYVFMGAVMGLAFATAGTSSAKGDELPPALFGLIFGGIGLAIFMLLVTVAILKFVTARNIRRRQSKIFCLVIAGLSCLEFPYGTFLGVCTFIVFGRESVKRLFEAAQGS
jgi:hypothetical protein